MRERAACARSDEILQRLSVDKRQFDWAVFVRLIGLARPYRSVLIFCCVLAVVLAPLATAKPWLINRIVDDYIAVSDIDGLLKMVLILWGIHLGDVLI